MDIKKVNELYKKYRTPAHIIKHCKQVAKVAEKIGRSYLKKGIDIDLDSLIYAALLHDLMRIIDINEIHYKKLCDDYIRKYGNARAKNQYIDIWNHLRKKYKGTIHCEAAYKVLHELGEEKIALMIKKHRFDAIIDKSLYPFTLEEEILTYADKRVLHTKIVSLKKRFEDGILRYNPQRLNVKREQKIHEAYFKLEKKLLNNRI
jgi:putative nucleotidyltransferase with HDIG domain